MFYVVLSVLLSLLIASFIHHIVYRKVRIEDSKLGLDVGDSKAGRAIGSYNVIGDENSKPPAIQWKDYLVLYLWTIPKAIASNSKTLSNHLPQIYRQ